MMQKPRFWMAWMLVALATFGLGGCQQNQSPTPEQLELQIRQLREDQAATQKRVDKLEADLASLSANTQQNKTVFTDLADIPNKKLIEDLAKLDTFQSIGPQFKPFERISRGTFVAWMFKVYNALNPTQPIQFAPALAPQFKDVTETHPAYRYVQALANAGYHIGYPDGTFKPEIAITREEMIAMKVNMDLGKTVSPSPTNISEVQTSWKFTDAGKIDPKYAGYIAEDAKITGPHGSNIVRTFGKTIVLNPKEPALRYEAAKLLWQFGPTGKQNLASP